MTKAARPADERHGNRYDEQGDHDQPAGAGPFCYMAAEQHGSKVADEVAGADKADLGVG